VDAPRQTVERLHPRAAGRAPDGRRGTRSGRAQGWARPDRLPLASRALRPL